MKEEEEKEVYTIIQFFPGVISNLELTNKSSMTHTYQTIPNVFADKGLRNKYTCTFLFVLDLILPYQIKANISSNLLHFINVIWLFEYITNTECIIFQAFAFFFGGGGVDLPMHSQCWHSQITQSAEFAFKKCDRAIFYTSRVFESNFISKKKTPIIPHTNSVHVYQTLWNWPDWQLVMQKV